MLIGTLTMDFNTPEEACNAAPVVPPCIFPIVSDAFKAPPIAPIGSEINFSKTFVGCSVFTAACVTDASAFSIDLSIPPAVVPIVTLVVAAFPSFNTSVNSAFESCFCCIAKLRKAIIGAILWLLVIM